MRQVTLPFAELFAIAGTRVALGIGIGLLVAGNLNQEQRQAAGWTLLLIGGLSTIPLVSDVLGRRAEPAQKNPWRRVAEAAYA